MLKVYLLIGLISIISAVGYTGYAYYVHTQQTIETLRSNNTKLELAVESKDQEIQLAQQHAKATEEMNATLQKELQASETYKDSLLQKLQKHNLTLLSLRKPELIEKRINDATKKLFADIELDTAN